MLPANDRASRVLPGRYPARTWWEEMPMHQPLTAAVSKKQRHASKAPRDAPQHWGIG